MEDGTPKPAEANDYYTAKRWWPENEQAVNGVPSAATKHNSDYYNSKEIFTPQVPREGDRVVLKDLIGMGGEEDDDVEERRYFRPAVSSEIEEISEDGESETDNRESGAEDIYVAVGKDDIDVVKWALDHAVSPSSRIFFVHVSVPVTLIPTPVGNLPISQLNQQRVRSYENEEINKTNNIMQKYIQLSNDAQVRAETVHLENNDTAKGLLELISVLNIRNLVMGIKKPPHPWGKNKLSRGEIVKQNAPEFCEVALVCVGNEVGKKSHYDIVSQRRHHSSGRFMSCLCFSVIRSAHALALGFIYKAAASPDQSPV
ncbi:uncharacterized protein LOC114723121 [Neltuma alba]|uniref:uncharacterized protein LOC114723121 n=1 Tax=Neltuma alba TaxID=207710 RepID=UPI0010A51363|nr:uncharacterized protein LOC114723121 [Prosopis alba]